MVPQRMPSPPPPPVQQQAAATAAALAAQRQAQQAALMAAQQQQAAQQQMPPALKQLKQQQQGQQPGPAAAAQQQPGPPPPAQQAQQAPMPTETLAAINKMVANARKANARAAAVAAQSGDVDEQEKLRRLKISQANKGRTPWNKGRRHSPETIARIRAATKVAMQRADVRERLQKANENRVPHSTEAKVGAAGALVKCVCAGSGAG